MRRRELIGTGASLAVPGLRGARAQRPDPNPDATVEIEEVRIGLLALGGTVGGGRLHYQGQDYAFTVRGLEAGSVGVSSLSARGEVFGLDALDRFPGTYAEHVPDTPAGGEGGPEVRWLRNPAGVVMRLRADRQGGLLQLSPSGLTIALR